MQWGGKQYFFYKILNAVVTMYSKCHKEEKKDQLFENVYHSILKKTDWGSLLSEISWRSNNITRSMVKSFIYSIYMKQTFHSHIVYGVRVGNRDFRKDWVLVRTRLKKWLQICFNEKKTTIFKMWKDYKNLNMNSMNIKDIYKILGDRVWKGNFVMHMWYNGWSLKGLKFCATANIGKECFYKQV